MGRRRLTEPGRYAISIECAHDLTHDEFCLLLELFKGEILTLQNHIWGRPPEHPKRMPDEADLPKP